MLHHAHRFAFVGLRRSLVMLVLSGAAAACSKAEPPSAESTPATAASAPIAAPATSAVVDASALVDASTDARAADAAPAASAKTESAHAADAQAAPTCGKKPLPDCPMQAWMKANTSSAMSAKDFAALEKALAKTATFAPEAGYPNWVSISKDGAEAARNQNMDALKASCRGCHDQYKSKYKAELRTRPVT